MTTVEQDEFVPCGTVILEIAKQVVDAEAGDRIGPLARQDADVGRIEQAHELLRRRRLLAAIAMAGEVEQTQSSGFTCWLSPRKLLPKQFSTACRVAAFPSSSRTRSG